MSSRARPPSGRAALAIALSLAASLAACSKDAPVSIAPEPRAPVEHAPRDREDAVDPAKTEHAPLDREETDLAKTEHAPLDREETDLAKTEDAPVDRAKMPSDLDTPPRLPGVKAETFTIDYPPLGFKMAIAVPEGGHLCIIVPESAQDPTSCLGLDTGAMAEALPQGPGRPFGVAHARTGDWSFDVIISPIPETVEAREDIESIVADTERQVREATSVTPKVFADAPGQRFDIFRVKDVPVVKFRIETPVAPDTPQFDQAETLYYAAYGAKAALVTFITSPKDLDKVLPYAEASVQTLVLPPRAAPERFGKPRAELSQQGTRTALMIFGPLVAFGILLFWWLGSRKNEPETAPAKPGAKTKHEDAEPAEHDDDEASEPSGNDDAEASDPSGNDDEASDPSGNDDEASKPSDRPAKKQDGAPPEEDAPPSDPEAS